MNGSLIYNCPTKLGNYRIFAKIMAQKLDKAVQMMDVCWGILFFKKGCKPAFTSFTHLYVFET